MTYFIKEEDGEIQGIGEEAAALTAALTRWESLQPEKQAKVQKPTLLNLEEYQPVQESNFLIHMVLKAKSALLG